MAPVIRISNELFRKLQAYGRPLIDTPSSVIERILEAFEGSQATMPELQPHSRPGRYPELEQAVSQAPQLFLAPASGENLRATIANAASFSKVRSVLTELEEQRILKILNGDDAMHCWAMTESRRGVFSAMKPGDVVLFSERGSGTFSFRGTVAGKVDSARLGSALWKVVPGKPWSLIYFLRDVRRSSIPKRSLVTALGFSPAYWVPGVIRIDPARLHEADHHHGSLGAFLDSF